MTDTQRTTDSQRQKYLMVSIPVLIIVFVFVFPSSEDSFDSEPVMLETPVAARAVKLTAAKKQATPEDAEAVWPEFDIAYVLTSNPFCPPTDKNREVVQQAEAQRDGAGENPAMGTATTELPPETPIEHRVDLIFESNGRHVAVIDGQVYRVGDVFQNRQILEIKDTAVLIGPASPPHH